MTERRSSLSVYKKTQQMPCNIDRAFFVAAIFLLGQSPQVQRQMECVLLWNINAPHMRGNVCMYKV